MKGATAARSARLLAVLAVVTSSAAACGGAGGRAARGPGAGEGLNLRGGKDRPPIAVVSRDGDPRGAIAAAVLTAGVAEARGADVAVALAGLVEARLRAAGLRDLTVVASWSGYRVRAFVASDAEAAAFATALRAALLTPIAAGDADALAAAQKKVTALARRPLPDGALADVARCTGEAFGPARPVLPRGAPVSIADLEAWRAGAHGVGRVALATAGAEALADAAGGALARQPAWPQAGAAAPPVALPSEDARPEIYELPPEITPGAARASVAVYTPRPAQAVTVAAAIADPRGAFASRLGALEPAPRIRDVAATAHVGGGCVAVTLEWPARDLASDGPSRLAMAVALARQELAVELIEVGTLASPSAETRALPGDAAFVRAIAHAAEDPRDAADRAAFWSFATSRDDGGLRIATAIGLGTGKDAPSEGAFAQKARDVRAALDRGIIAWHEPVIEVRSRVERAQGEMWLLLASPCGTLSEGDSDAGLSALVAAAAAEHVNDGLRGEGARAEGWASQEGVGLLVHGAARPSETPRAHARRLADAAARAFAAEALPAHAIARARAQVIARLAEQDGGRSIGALAGALATGHPSWILPWGLADSLGRASDASVAARAVALRAGPLRAAVIANVDVAQAQAAAQAIDRWIARRPGEARICPAASPPIAPRPGTYAADATGGIAEAWIAAPLGAADEETREGAAVLAAALDGEGGLLTRALEGSGLARSSSARVLGGARAPALALRLTTPPGSLDAAVAQTRALLDRLRQGALTDADRQRALVARDQRATQAAADPRTRLMTLFRDAREARDDRPRAAPSLEALRALSSAALRDEGLVIVAAQPRVVR